MDAAGGNESVNPRPLGMLNRLPRGSNVLLVAPREATDDGNVAGVIDGVPDLGGDHLDGLEVVLGGGGEAGLDDVDAELRELARDVEFLLGGHGSSRGLLAVAEGGVKDAHVRRVGDVVGDVRGTTPFRLGARNRELVAAF